MLQVHVTSHEVPSARAWLSVGEPQEGRPTLLAESMCFARWAACVVLGSAGCTDTLSRPEAPATCSCLPYTDRAALVQNPGMRIQHASTQELWNTRADVSCASA